MVARSIDPMNIIVVMLDSLRPDFLGCYGNKEVKSPTIDKIAAEGMVFTRAYAEFPITIPSRTAFLCGIYTHTNRPWMKPRLEDPKLAAFLKANGYETAAIGDTALTWGHLDDLGFDYFKGFKSGKCAIPRSQQKFFNFKNAYFPPGFTEMDRTIYRNTVLSQMDGLEQFGKKSPEIVTDEMINWIDQHKHEKFFLWADYFEPHEPWAAPPEYLKSYSLKSEGRFIPMPPIGRHSLSKEELHNILANYMATITQVDAEIARIDEHLSKLNLVEDTLLIVTSDHGEPFGEHGTIRKYGVPLYEELSRIVSIWRKPGFIPRGKKENALVLNVDLPSTIASILNTERPHKFEGLSLLPLIREESDSIREEAFIGAYNLHAGIVTSPWKFIDNRGETENELYDLKEDPEEKTNLINEEKDLAKRLHLRIWQFQKNWSFSLAWHDRLNAPRDMEPHSPRGFK